MTTITGHEARDRLDELIDGAAESHQPVTIIGKRHDAILISAEDWTAMQAALHRNAPAEQGEFLARGLASRDEAKRSGQYVDSDKVLAEFDGMAADAAGKPPE